MKDVILCAMLPNESQEYILQWTYPLMKVSAENIAEAVTEGNELVDLPNLRKKLQDLEKKIEVEQRILSGAQKMATGQGSNKLHFLNMKSASSETADNISDFKNQLRSVQKHLEIGEASFGVWLRCPGEGSFKVVFSSNPSRESPFLTAFFFPPGGFW